MRINIAALVVILLVAAKSAFAQEVDLPDQRIYPDNVFYPLKRGYEKTREKLIFSEGDKQKYYLSLFRNRIAELDYITENKLGGFIETSSNRASAFAGKVADSISVGGYSEKEKGLTEVFAGYIKYLETMRDRYPSQTAEWRFLQQNLDTLQILSNKLRE